MHPSHHRIPDTNPWYVLWRRGPSKRNLQLEMGQFSSPGAGTSSSFDRSGSEISRAHLCLEESLPLSNAVLHPITYVLPQQASIHSKIPQGRGQYWDRCWHKYACFLASPSTQFPWTQPFHLPRVSSSAHSELLARGLAQAANSCHASPDLDQQSSISCQRSSRRTPKVARILRLPDEMTLPPHAANPIPALGWGECTGANHSQPRSESFQPRHHRHQSVCTHSKPLDPTSVHPLLSMTSCPSCPQHCT
mmetsp:Transcript_26038/g.60177  ORF Transcript_26038/g.60177 Transcript_26038/m.60177 type:complete len:249 (+) Transcript_26038:490-1236(+)